MNAIEKVHAITEYLKRTFIGKDEIADLLAVGLLAGENVFLLGPPGTAKSAIVRTLSGCIAGGANFEYLLTRFTEPAEIFGPFDIRKLKEGELLTNTDGMLPEASLIFLDELFNANSAILNSLLTALNEKTFRRGKETRQIPALLFVGASNGLPEDETLAALLDRFLIRVRCDYVDPDLLNEVLLAGRALERSADASEQPTVTPEEVKRLQAQTRTIDLSPVLPHYLSLVHSLRNSGIKVSDRRAVKLQNLIAASALISGRQSAILSDLWVLRHIWDTEQQIEILAGMVAHIIDADSAPGAHPQVTKQQRPDAEALAAELEMLTQRWEAEGEKPQVQAALRDKLRYLQSRAGWITAEEPRQFLEAKIEALWQKMLQTA